MSTSTLTFSWSSLISAMWPGKSANGPSLIRTVSLSSNSWVGRERLVGDSTPSAFTWRIDSTSLRLSGVGLDAEPTKPVTPGEERIANHTSSDGVHRTSRYPGKTFLETVTFLP